MDNGLYNVLSDIPGDNRSYLKLGRKLSKMVDQEQDMKWFYLIIGAVIIGLFIFAIAPFIVHQPDTFEDIAEFIDTNNINTDAYSYTDSEFVARATIGARSTIEHFPKGPDGR